MSKNSELKHGYQPIVTKGKGSPSVPLQKGYQPVHRPPASKPITSINEGYQPTTSTTSQPPNIGTSVTKPKK